MCFVSYKKKGKDQDSTTGKHLIKEPCAGGLLNRVWGEGDAWGVGGGKIKAACRVQRGGQGKEEGGL